MKASLQSFLRSAALRRAMYIIYCWHHEQFLFWNDANALNAARLMANLEAAKYKAKRGCSSGDRSQCCS